MNEATLPNDLPQKNQASIAKIEKQAAITDVKVDRLVQDISEIKNNHLLHINNELRTMTTTIAANQITVTQLITAEVSKLYKVISSLQVNDAKQAPGNALFSKIIEYVVLGVIGLGIAYLASR